MSNKEKNLVVSLVFMAFGIFLFVESMGIKHMMKNDVGSAFFPKVISVAMIIFAVICLVQALRMEEKESKKTDSDKKGGWLTVLLIAGYVLLMASFGLFVGLKMPNLHWTNEITPIKQGGAVMLALFSGFAYAALIVVGYLLLGSKIGLTAYLAAFAALTLLLAALLLRWLHKTGCRIFASL